MIKNTIIALIFIILVFVKVEFVCAGAIEELKKDSKDAHYAKAYKVRDFNFPEDHSAHNLFKTEWWYFTGNLQDKQERDFAYQLTLFRNNISPQENNRGWKSNQVYMGHFGLSDIKNKKFYSCEVFQRAAKGLAGAKEKPYKIWLNDWSISSKSVGEDIFPLELHAKKGPVSISFNLEPKKAIALQGDRGLSQKSKELGNASYYYSYPRLETSGEISIEGQSFEISGLSWMDREWSTSALGDSQTGWDWFSLQFSDDYDLMYYQLRKELDGKSLIDEYSLGSFLNPESKKSLIRVEDIELKVLDYWTSKATGIKYPAEWQIVVAKEALDINVKPLMNNQEHEFDFAYWEGAVSIKGKHLGKSISGKGYVELTGYK